METEYYEMNGDTGEIKKLKGQVDFNNFKTETPSGQVMKVEPLENDTHLVTTLNQNGKKIKEDTYTSKDNKNVLTREFYENGNIHVEINFKNGKYNGDCNVWDEDGNHVQYMEYDNGELISMATKKESELPIVFPVDLSNKYQPDNAKDTWDRFMERVNRCPDKYRIGVIKD